MKGFKSFANRTKIEFDNRITAVVGPNGSGKSNISDAVKWVLGEQSVKSLRGSKMNDVIFSGGENSSPLNLAEVNLNFSNDDKSLDLDYSNVKISRRIYRNGDNEYKINGKKVRLKDIRELFLDTGVGKEGYSVIGQGRIEEIINSTPKERRSIFEEASGISKHKYRRDESEKKLEKVSDNLEIIEREWEYKKKDLKLLESQKDNYEKNKALTEELDIKAYFYFNNKSKKLYGQKTEIEKKLLELRDNRLVKEKDYQNLNESLLPFNQEIKSINQKLEENQELIKRLENSITKNKNQIELNKQNLFYNNKDLKKSLSDNENNLSRKRQLEEKISVQEKSLENILKKINFLKDEDKKLNLKKEELKASIKATTTKIKNLEFEKNSFDKKIYEYDLNEKTNLILNKQREENNKKTREKIKEVKVNLYKIAQTIKEVDKTLEKLREDLDRKKITYNENKSNLEELLIENTNLSDRLNSNNMSLKEEISTYKIQKDLLARNEGYYYSIQEFLKETSNSSLNHLYMDTLANLINVRDGYESVIEILMSSSLQNIVTKTKDDTRQLINFVNKKKLGRITFLPIDSIASSRKKLPDEKEAIAMACDLVDHPPELTSIINHFLGSTLVVKNIDDAIKLSSKIKGYRIITMDLDVINTWGSMVAGKNNTKKSNVGLINRSKKIDEIKKHIVFLKEKNELLSKEISENKIKMDGLKDSQNILEDDISKIGNELNLYSSSKQKGQYEKKALEDRLKELNGLLSEQVEKEEIYNIDIIRERAFEIENNLKELRIILETSNKSLIDTDNKIIQSSNQLEISQRDKNLINNNIEENRIELNNIEDSNKFFDRVKTSLEKEICNLEKNIENLGKNLLDDSEKLEIAKQKVESYKKESDEKLSKNKIMVEKSSTLKKEIDDIDLELVKINYKNEAIINDIKNLEDEISPFISKNLEEISNLSINEEVKSISKIELINLQKKINQVGFFDENSLENYKKAKEDFDFLDKQKNDLKNSKDDIEKMIKKLESDMKEEFIKNFKIIDEKFQRIFQTLFMGGKAKLTLDDEDELNAGVEIMACPPGKSSKSISLLSGGEKSLTAVSLLFAIFETNPAPFSLLDEIDAAMDEANIKRYIEYLKSLSDNTQFVMITHRQTTMQLAERIHGVTIGDDGISKVYSIDFDKN